MEQHLKHIKYLEALIDRASPNSDAWWKLKDRLKQVQIAWGQSINIASQKLDVSGEGFDKYQAIAYEKITAPLTHNLEQEYKERETKKVETERDQLLSTTI